MTAFLAVSGLTLALSLSIAQQEPSEQELAAARWIEGRVTLPVGTPPDEHVRVVALGREFESGGHHSAELGADGRFRVAVPQKTRTLRLELRSPHLYLEQPVRLRSAELPAEVLLEPALGGRLAVELSVEADEGSLRLDDAAAVEEGADGSERAFAFEGLPPSLDRRLSWSESGVEHSVSGLGVVRGATLTVRIGMASSPELRGRLVDEEGHPLAGTRLLADEEELRTDAEASFALEPRWNLWKALEWGSSESAGTVASEGWLVADGFLPARWSLHSDSPRLEVEATFVLRRAPSLAGRILHADGSPAAGWCVEAFAVGEEDPGEDSAEDIESEGLDSLLGFHSGPSSPPPSTAIATADGEGRFTLAAPGPGKLRLCAWGARDGERWIAERAGVTVGGPPVELVLTRGSSLAGRAIDERGEPLTRGIVRATREPGTSAFDVVEQAFESVEGAFLLDGLQDGEWTVEVAGGAHLATSSAEAWLDASGGRTHVMLLDTLRAIRAARVLGRVVDGAGAPLPGAWLHAYPVTSILLYWTPEDAWADGAEDGSFLLERVLPGGTQIAVSAPGHSERVLTVELLPGATLDLGAIRLDRASRVRGVALDRSGQPLAGVPVELYDRDDVTDPIADTEADVEGRFEFEDVSAGKHEVLARPEGILSLVAWEPFEVASEGASIEVRQHAPSELVTVLVELTSEQEPVTGASVFLSPPEAIAADANRYGAEQEPGVYELVVPPGKAWLTVLDENDVLLARVPREIAEPDVGGRKQKLALALPSGSVRVRVTTQEGMDSDYESVWIEPVEWTDRLPFGPAYLDGDGCLFRCLPDGRYRVVAGGSELVWDEPDPNLTATVATEVEIRSGARATASLHLARARSLRGTVRASDGTPVPAARLWVWTEERVPLDLFDLATDVEGRFVAWNLPSVVWVAASSGLAATPAPVRVELEPDDSSELDLALGPATMIDVRPVDESGAPVRALVRALDEQGFAFRTPSLRRALSELDFSLGDFDLMVEEMQRPQASLDAFFLFLGPLPPGRYRLQAKTLDGRRGEVQLELSGAGERSLQIVVR